MEATRTRAEIPIHLESTNKGRRTCEVIIEDGILDNLGDEIAELSSSKDLGRRVVTVTDSHVGKLYGSKLLTGISKEFSSASSTIEIKAGEKSKSLVNASALCDKLAKLGTDRNSALIALGGGVVGDLTGFVACIYKRGIEYFQVPTTLLAQVDSSIGGKTGVDTEWGKNQLGTFHQPRAVFIDPTTLDTLPKKETINGVAEIVKSAIVADRRIFDRLCDAQESDLLSLETLKPLIPSVCRIKAQIVAKDETEVGPRATLNFGHTVGHAIESASSYSLSHGRCVILGMIAESWVAWQLDLFEERDFSRSQELLERLLNEIAVSQKARQLLGNKKELTRLAMSDKKSTTSGIRMSLPERIGRMSVGGPDGNYKVPVSNEMFVASINYLREHLA
jgi:3-dehydroquinate synthase